MTLAIQDHYADPILDDTISRDVIIDNRDNSNDLEDYQIQLNIDDNYLLFQSERGIRFVDENLQVLDYWEESDLSEWIEVSKIIGSKSTTIKMLQKEGLGSASNGDDTFVFFDDFPGTSLDTSKWTSVESPTITVSNSILEIYFDTDVGQYIYGSVGVGYNHQLEAWAKYNAITTQAAMELSSSPDVPDPWKNSIGIWTEWGNYDHNIVTATSGTIIQNTNFPTTAVGEYKRYKIRREGAGVASVWKDDESITADDPDLITGTAYPDIFGNSAAGGAHSHWVDWIFIRKYLSPEPTAVIE